MPEHKTFKEEVWDSIRVELVYFIASVLVLLIYWTVGSLASLVASERLGIGIHLIEDALTFTVVLILAYDLVISRINKRARLGGTNVVILA